METRVRYPIGTSDFAALRRDGAYYVDKSLFIRDVIRSSGRVLLLPRPRRFGKTLNLSMARCFFDPTHAGDPNLFAGLAIESDAEAREHRHKHPTIFLTLKDVRGHSWDACLDTLRRALARLFEEHRYVLDGPAFPRSAAETFRAILDARAEEGDLANGLADLSRALSAHHGDRVVILVDEYDTPIHAGYSGGYFDRCIAFFRNFLSGAFKDNPDLFKGVLTGVLRVAKESIFSGLNNLAVFSILRPEFSTYFGFTEEEVARAAEAIGAPQLLDGMRTWYEGYQFGGQVIYNPWSVLNFLDSQDKTFRPYWVSTGSNDIIRELMASAGGSLRPELEDLLRGESIDRAIEENIVLRDLAARPDAVWSFLLFSGYLKTLSTSEVGGVLRGRLAIPNVEISGVFNSMVQDWLGQRAGGSSEVERLLDALLRGDARSVEYFLSTIVATSLSYHDTAKPDPERVLHGFVIGLLVSLATRYDVRSNRETGFGRSDVLVIPKSEGQPGVVLELKRVDRARGETEDAALDAALTQIRDRDYAAELRARGAHPIHELAVAFDGKRVWVRGR